LAGRPGDRWASLRKKAGREESPDTVVFNVMAEDESLWRGALGLKGNAPGNARGWFSVIQLQGGIRLTEVPQKINRRSNFASVTPLEETFSRSDAAHASEL